MKHRNRVPKPERPKGRYRFPKDDCRGGYQAALRRCMEDWDLYAWFHIRGHYRRRE